MPQRDDRPTEKTPKGHEVPVPKRGEVMGNLRKIAKVRERSDYMRSRPGELEVEPPKSALPASSRPKE